MSKHYKVTYDAPNAEHESGAMESTLETDDPNEVTNQIVALAGDNPGKPFTFTITATDIHNA